MLLRYISVTTFSYTDPFLNRISLDWNSRGNAMTNDKKIIDVTTSIDRDCRSFTKEKVCKKKKAVCKNAVS